MVVPTEASLCDRRWCPILLVDKSAGCCSPLPAREAGCVVVILHSTHWSEGSPLFSPLCAPSAPPDDAALSLHAIRVLPCECAFPMDSPLSGLPCPHVICSLPVERWRSQNAISTRRTRSGMHSPPQAHLQWLSNSATEKPLRASQLSRLGSAMGSSRAVAARSSSRTASAKAFAGKPAAAARLRHGAAGHRLRGPAEDDAVPPEH